MSMMLDAKLSDSGTRFKVFAQPRVLKLRPFLEPETIRISIKPGDLSPGPADSRMFVVDAVNKRPYRPGQTPPYIGPRNAPVEPGKDGHFDHLVPGTREFSSAHMYAVVRRVLDIWEDYFEHEIRWHFAPMLQRLLLIPLVKWDNAQSGFGFLEFGYGSNGTSLDFENPYCENFDVLAHELGHSIINSQVGYPASEQSSTADYDDFHESSGDLTALVAALHFTTVVDVLLHRTAGNLFTRNELARVGELSESEEIRSAFNDLKMGDVGEESHDRSEPLTGALFDIFVEVFQKELVERAAISQHLADRSFHEGNSERDNEEIQSEFEQAFSRHAGAFKSALIEARDYWGRMLAKTWTRLSPDYLTYSRVALAALAADSELTDGKHQATIRTCFGWRDIPLFPSPLAAVAHRWLTPSGRRHPNR